ncbi:MAG: hypothetical protein WKG06_12790 [Segetibacter sp.]
MLSNIYFKIGNHPKQNNIKQKLTVILMMFGLSLFLASSSAMAQGVTLRLVLNTNNDGPGSVRQAIVDANSYAFDDVISFDSRVFGITPQIISIARPSLEITASGSLTIKGPRRGC